MSAHRFDPTEAEEKAWNDFRRHWHRDGFIESLRAGRSQALEQFSAAQEALTAEKALREDWQRIGEARLAEYEREKARADAAEKDWAATVNRVSRERDDLNVALAAEVAALAAARRECEGLRKDVVALLPMAERALRDEMPPPGCAGPRDDGRSLEDSLRVAREGALLLRLRHQEIAALAAPAAGDSK